MKTLLLSIAMTGALSSFSSAQSKSCYGLDINPFPSQAAAEGGIRLDMSASGSVILTGPDHGSFAAKFVMDIVPPFGGSLAGAGVTYNGSIEGSDVAGHYNPYPDGGVVVQGYALGNFSPHSVQLVGITGSEMKGYRVCETDVQTWTMLNNSSVNAQIFDFEKGGYQVYYGASAKGKDLRLLNYSNKVWTKGGWVYRISGGELESLSHPSSLTLYGSKNNGVNLTPIAKVGNSGVATVFSDFEICICNVPEPSSVSLLGLGGVALILRRRRK